MMLIFGQPWEFELTIYLSFHGKQRNIDEFDTTDPFSRALSVLILNVKMHAFKICNFARLEGFQLK